MRDPEFGARRGPGRSRTHDSDALTRTDERSGRAAAQQVNRATVVTGKRPAREGTDRGLSAFSRCEDIRTPLPSDPRLRRGIHGGAPRLDGVAPRGGKPPRRARARRTRVSSHHSPPTGHDPLLSARWSRAAPQTLRGSHQRLTESRSPLVGCSVLLGAIGATSRRAGERLSHPDEIGQGHPCPAGPVLRQPAPKP